ncbi:MAG: hypothetical protein Wins2KO_10210 [Winogradskyella sp.]
MNNKSIKLTLLSILLVFSINAFSQDSDQRTYKFGVNLGANLFELNQNDLFEQYNGRLNYSLGFSFEYDIDSSLSLLSGINFDKKSTVWEFMVSSTSNGGFGSFTVEDKIRFSYINVPVYLRYHIGNSKNIGLNLGGYYNHTLNVENEAKIVESESLIHEVGDEFTTQPAEDIISNDDFGMLIGLSYQFAINDKNHFSLELRNEFGLANISQITAFNEVKTNTLKLILNWQLPI